ncbi:MAG: transglycosylase domain-containing protein [Actinomycetota bacterium]|nr:transglycosylase domain-containing protein [Actinomycetota bacterium]
MAASRGRLVARGLLVLVLAVVVAVTTFVGGLLAAPLDVRTVPPAPKPVLLLGADGTQFGQIRPTQRREVLPGDQIPEVVRQAVISAEDARFLDHRGVDPLATLRAAYRDLTGGRRQGGSTITQQYVKNVYVGNDRTLGRKIREASVAVRLEQRKSKDDILTDYLNVLYLGNSTYGVQAASRYYFGVGVQELGLEAPGAAGPPDPVVALARASMLAGIAPAPSAWNPVRDFAQARGRQKYTLNQMVAGGFITPAEASEAYRREAAVVPERVTPPEPPSTAPEYADIVTAQLQEQFGDDPDQLDRGGLRVRTALDTDLQEAVTRAAREVLPDQDDPQAAVVAVDTSSGDVTAMTTLRRRPGRGDVEAVSGYTRGGFNLATNGRRSTGSTIKPFTLAAALEKGLTLDTRRDAPACDTIGDYRYCNAAGEHGGSRRLTLQRALQASVNTVYVPLAIEAGRPRIKQLMLDAGVVADEDAFATEPASFGLGTTALVSPLSMANAYGTLLNGGTHVAPRYLLETHDVDGRLLSREPERPEPVRRALPAPVAEQVAEAMSGVTEPGGTARAARQDFQVWGKTGTTNDSTNAWFIGCSREGRDVCIAVWMGYDDERCTGGLTRSCGGMEDVHGVEQVYGGTLPAEIYDRTWEILEEIEVRRAAEPSG